VTVAVRIRTLFLIAGSALLALSAAHGDDPVVPREPGRLGIAGDSPGATHAVNQQLANDVAARLNQLSQLKGFRVDISVSGSTVDLQGHVATQQQHDLLLSTVRAVPGVARVVDRVVALDRIPLVQTQLLQPEPGPLPPQKEDGPPPLLQNPVVPPAAPMPPEPTPIFQPNPQTPSANGYAPPRMPPYAWPTYAPYPNYSRVAYPMNYPYQSFPFIGPVYPYPKVPLGWRNISLTWQDGFWWYGRNSSGHDWWRMRVW
jgi:hypothetical protein